MRRSTLALYSLARCKLGDVGAADMIWARFTTFTMINLILPDWTVVFDTKTGVFVAAPRLSSRLTWFVQSGRAADASIDRSFEALGG